MPNTDGMQLTKECSNCGKTAHRVFKGVVQASLPPQRPTAWVCLDCGHVENAPSHIERHPNATNQNKAIDRLHGINPMYSFVLTPEIDSQDDEDG